MDIVLSGIRPTGNLHLGNYFGALRNFVKLQHEAECFFFIADYHSLTTHTDPSLLHGNVKNVLAEYLAAGIDPEAATIYVQSDVPQVAELSLLLGMHAHIPELLRTASFKDKVSKLRGKGNREEEDAELAGVSAGLLTYPVLMAADILQHRADKVPVGKDQEQHLEMTRFYARRFNSFYGVEYFKEPEAYNFGTDLVKIPGLDGSGKMGKSEGNAVYLIDSDDAIRKKVMRAVTDSGPTVPDSPVSEPVENIFTIMKAVSDPAAIQFFRDKYASCEIRYGDLKKQLAEDIIRAVTPIRERIEDIRSDEAYLRRVAALGAEKARESAAKTVADVRNIMGIRAF